jgi:hypothetical protein
MRSSQVSEGDFAREERTLAVAARVFEVLRQHGIDAAVIGAIAMAVHGYSRATEDLDLATNTEPFTKLRAVEQSLRQQGLNVKFTAPDSEDPLGGTLLIEGDDVDPIQVVNFQNPWPEARDCSLLAQEALQGAKRALDPDSPLPVVSLTHLIALKLYAGGWKSKADIEELLERNREHLNVAELRDVCTRHGLGPALEPLLQELGFT